MIGRHFLLVALMFSLVSLAAPRASALEPDENGWFYTGEGVRTKSLDADKRLAFRMLRDVGQDEIDDAAERRADVLGVPTHRAVVERDALRLELEGEPIAAQSAIADAARIQGRVAGASEEEILAARDVVRSALAHPLLVRARAAERMEREVPVMLREDDGGILEGVVDLAFFEPDSGWMVVDFKTDLALGERAQAYANQVALYARAISAATGAPASGAVLRI